MPCILKTATTDKVSVSYVIGEVRAINSSAACILQTSVHVAIQPHFLVQLVQGIAAEKGQFQNQHYWYVRKDGQTEICVATADCVAASLQSGTKNRHCDVVSCIFVCKLHVGQLFVCLSLWNGEQSNCFCGSHLQNQWRLATAAQNFYSAGRLKETFEIALSTDADMKL